ncbi:agamous-like MADS-box protein AGL80 [Triticum dicoccoides]|uniref:agamous-like MADS-box protein AGL80 n=1 Tax=Triticum dicoccoides TaxID=85692 RepID=UPI00162BA152|nr:agamous-like MADS-box protein AGL80 [Triticum dicoccoides]XP_044425757.1 agamous-like MADS-box protein AGL80 [Triticum aestivum]
MARNVTLQYIPHDSTRRNRFKKRLKGLMKKADELAVLCDAKTCVLVYDEGKVVPEVFPSKAEAVGILNQFKITPELGRCKEVMNQKGFITKRIDKLGDQVDKTRRECEDGEIRSLLHKTMHGDLSGLVGLNIEELIKVGYKVDVLLKSIMERMAKIHSQAPPPAPCVTTGSIYMGSPALYMAPPQQESQLDMVSSGGDLDTLVYGGYANTNFSSSDMMMQMHSFDMGFGSSPFPPM